MSCFQPLDDCGRLWQVRDLLPPAQAEEILRTDWTTVLVGLSRNGQEEWPRLQVDHMDPVAQRYYSYINECLPEINRALGTSFERMGGHFWIDQPGFQVGMHTDGQLPNAMQVYWTVPGPEWGTSFYRYKTLDSLLYQFCSEPNSGYIMLNHLNPDGSQPLQWHAMRNPVPQGHIRVTSYWRFN